MFKKNLRFLRKKHNLTLQDIANICMKNKKSRSLVSNWESGIAMPNTEKMLLISNFFSISINDLVVTDLSKQKMTWRKS